MTSSMPNSSTSTGTRPVRSLSLRTLRERAGVALLRAGAELAFDQQALERSFATAPRRQADYSSAQSAVAMAAWVDDALLWLGWRILPSTVARSV